VAVKILAVDDSPTMRQILELTFAGEDAEVTTVESGQQAVDTAASLQPDVVLADVSMTGMDGYAVAQAIKANGSAAVILLSSQHNPYDEAKGKASGVDDHVAKPFDSQVIIDKVTQLAGNRPQVASKPLGQTSQGPAAAGPSAGGPQQPTPSGGRVSKRTMAFGTSPVAPPQPPAPPKPPAAEPPKRPVLELADEPEVEIEVDEPTAPAAPKPAAPPAAKPPAPAAAKPPAPAKPAPAKPAPPQPAPAAKPAAAAASATASGGDMAKKLDELGLSKEQVEAVLALSREVVEQVVWEVVPDLAETLILEEIARLTQE